MLGESEEDDEDDDDEEDEEDEEDPLVSLPVLSGPEAPTYAGGGVMVNSPIDGVIWLPPAEDVDGRSSGRATKRLLDTGVVRDAYSANEVMFSAGLLAGRGCPACGVVLDAAAAD